MAILDAKLPARQASTVAISPTKAEAKVLEGKAPLAIDGGGFGSAVRILLKNQVKTEQNGLFEVTTNEAVGGTGTVGGTGKVGSGEAWVLTRTADADSSGEVTEGMLVPIEDGTVNRKTSWIQRTAGPIEVGVTAQTFESLVAGALGAAGGDLTGSYSEPSIAEAVIDNSNVEVAAGIKGSKLDLKASVAATDLATSAKELAPQLPVPAKQLVTRGPSTATFPGASEQTEAVVIDHGLGETPTVAIVSRVGEGELADTTYNYTKTQFTAKFKTVDGSKPTAGTKLSFAWFAMS